MQVEQASLPSTAEAINRTDTLGDLLNVGTAQDMGIVAQQLAARFTLTALLADRPSLGSHWSYRRDSWTLFARPPAALASCPPVIILETLPSRRRLY